ncbi:CBS domain-containing protein [Kushneria sinocarnis]|uniref:CBS domain-containing protein n=1 Tax=Kushneria sinocarnis TaxID=595502 RepID=A0A420WWG3_9GAMM|nr:CBS domain-containing protein [Kushneria sinocarnis]RKR03433.1 CBS domain-containing protein [Kushneria sinocarnis]
MNTTSPALVADIMIREVITLRVEQSLHDGHELMREHRIRHLPVVDGEGRLVGLLNQKIVLRESLHIADGYGTRRLNHHLAQIPLDTVISRDVLTLAAGMPLAEAGRHLLASRQGAMPVLDEAAHLVGILSSVDFVKLAVQLLDTNGS